jgi:SAM-dependent methyltransferase
LSANALSGLCERCFGVEPVERMLALAKAVAPRVGFAAGRAEALPFASGAFGLITAAGALNFVSDLARAAGELLRVLAPGGTLVVYDFSHGRSFRDSVALEEWCEEFYRRWPAPEGEAIELNPEILAGMHPGLRLRWRERFEIGLRLEAAFYAGYVLTETNVAAAVRRGEAEGPIREWCEETLPGVFGGAPREVLFRGYAAGLTPAEVGGDRSVPQHE